MLHRVVISTLRKTVPCVLLLAVPSLAAAGPASAGSGNPSDHSAKRLTVAVIGDVPYGTDQEARFGELVDAINDDPKVRIAAHLGDIKNGSTTCSDERFSAIADAVDRFEDPVIYTPGDNEWTDCHRTNNGAYNPLERFDTLRSIFFAQPGLALGRHPMRVDYQATSVENVRWVESRVAFATLHVVGSNNGLAPWTGLGQTMPTAEQIAEVDTRIEATLAWIDQTFDIADAEGLEGVVLAMQADTWTPTPGSGQQAIVDRITERTAAFDGDVLLLQGDSHLFTADNPMGLDNFTRIVVHGETLPFEYLRLTIDPGSNDLFSWERVMLTES
ncbi:MAG TPA: metallophosphoesterase [Jiangellaceae bacterium]|nr:metallophosphoesterase [Jiangellaceae bacterium]